MKRVADFRAYLTPEEARLQARLAADEAKLAEMEIALSVLPRIVARGSAEWSIGSAVSITTAGVKDASRPFAGVRPGDLVFAVPASLPPAGYGFPQALCRTAGRIELRIDVPVIAAGAPILLTINLTALRAPD